MTEETYAGVFGTADEAELVAWMQAVTSLGWSGPVRRPSTPAPCRARYGWRNASVRSFAPPHPSDREVASVIEAAYGGPGDRPVPSAGGLYALRLVVADLGEGAPARGAGTVWAALSPGESEAMAEAFFGSVAGPHCVVVFAGAPEAPVLRYGARGYRYLLLEAGHCAQELLRAAQAIGLHSCPLGAFDDQALSALLRLDWSGEIPLYAVAIGRAAGS